MNIETKTAKELFFDEVTALERDRKCSFQDAWRLAQQIYRNLYLSYQAELKQGNAETSKAAESIIAEGANEQQREDRKTFIEDLMRRHRCDYPAAWGKARNLRPDLFAKRP